MLSLTTNVDLQNVLSSRIPQITNVMETDAIEIFTLPQNYFHPDIARYPSVMPEKKSQYGKFNILSKELAQNIGEEMRKNSVSRIQLHYPWQKSLMDMDGQHIALTIAFCDIISNVAEADRFTINYHNVRKFSADVLSEKSQGDRQIMHQGLAAQALEAKYIRDGMESDCLLIVENNPALSKNYDSFQKSLVFDCVDQVAEDFANRKHIDGINFDVSHAWTVIKYFTENPEIGTFGTMEWLREQYQGKVPESAKSMESFVKTIALRTNWLHLSDESTAYEHLGKHIGDGSINHEESLRLLIKHLTENTPVTIETGNGHTPEGFKRVLKQDFPRLKAILETL